MKDYLGAQASLKELRITFLGLKQYPSEPFPECYSRSRPYAFACHKSKVFPNNESFLVYQFTISCCNEKVQNFFQNILCRLFQEKKLADTLTGSDSFYLSLTNN